MTELSSNRPKPPEVSAPLFIADTEGGTQLMGSAIRVAEDILLSCSHCLELFDRALDARTGERIETNDGNILNVLERDRAKDLVLLQASRPLPAPAAPLVFQTRKPKRTAQLSVSGYPGTFEGGRVLAYDEARLLLTGTSGVDGSLYDVQFTGGLSEGVSGAAVFGWVGGEWRCLAMARLGSAEAGHSRGIGAGILVDFLRANKIDVAVKDISNEPIAKLVVGGGQSGRMIQGIRDEDDDLQPPLRQGRSLPPTGTRDVFWLLDWRAGLTPLGGRDDSLNNLLTWARSGCDVRARFLAGPGGSGKSRLAREAVEVLREDGWMAGETFLEKPDRPELISPKGLFLVVDDPEPWRPQVRRLLQNLARIGRPPAPIRVLFVTRLPIGEWQSEIDQAYLPDVQDTRIGPLEKTEAIQLFSDAIHRFSQYLALPVQTLSETAIGEWLDVDPGLHRLPLFTVAAALHRVLTDQTDQDEVQLTGAEIIEALMRRERERIDKIAQDAGWAAKAAARLVGLAAITGGLDAAGIRRLETETEIGLPKERILDAAESLGFWQNRRVPAPKPDIVAAEFLFAVLKDSKGQASAWLWATLGDAAAEHIDDLGRLAYDIAKLRGRQAFEEFATWLAGVVKGSLDRANRWKTISTQDNLPAGLLPLAIAIGREVHTDPSIEEDKRAAIFTALSNRLYDRGIYPEALAASEDAVKILKRKMAEKDPARYEAQFADALRSYAACLWKEDDIAEAVRASRDSVDILRRLARLNPAVYEPHLAKSLRTLSNTLSASSDNGRAGDVMRQAVEIWTRREEESSGRYAMELAQSLNNLAVCLYEEDEIEAARDSVQNAIDIWRKLARGSPARYEPGLALAICNLSYFLRDINEQQANDLLREGIEIFSRVAEANPAHEPDFARNLEALAHNLVDTNKAINALKQATEIRKKLALARPERFEPGLVRRLDRQLYQLSPSRAVGYLRALRIGVKTFCVLLVRGESPEGKFIFAYVAVRADKLETFMEAQMGGMFYPEDFGVILESGMGEVPPKVRTKMETEYGFNHQAMVDIPNAVAAGDLFMNLTPPDGGSPVSVQARTIEVSALVVGEDPS